MTAAVVRASYYGAAAPTPAGVTAETGITMNRADSQTGTTPIPIPTTTGSNYSWMKQLALEVTTISSPATTLSNATVRLSGSLATGLLMFWVQASTMSDQTGGTAGPADVGTNNAGAPSTPATYTIVTTTANQYDAMGTASNGGSTGRKSNFLKLILGVSDQYAGGPGSASLGNIIVGYDEA